MFNNDNAEKYLTQIWEYHRRINVEFLLYMDGWRFWEISEYSSVKNSNQKVSGNVPCSTDEWDKFDIIIDAQTWNILT